jgi:hypothetical protein
VKTTVSHTSVCGPPLRPSPWSGGVSDGEVVVGCPAGLRGGGGSAGRRRRVLGDLRQEGVADQRAEADSLLRIHTLPQEHP